MLHEGHPLFSGAHILAWIPVLPHLQNLYSSRFEATLLWYKSPSGSGPITESVTKRESMWENVLWCDLLGSDRLPCFKIGFHRSKAVCNQRKSSGAQRADDRQIGAKPGKSAEFGGKQPEYGIKDVGCKQYFQRTGILALSDQVEMINSMVEQLENLLTLE